MGRSRCKYLADRVKTHLGSAISQYLIYYTSKLITMMLVRYLRIAYIALLGLALVFSHGLLDLCAGLARQWEVTPEISISPWAYVTFAKPIY
jgi:hypothetical protein